VPTVQGKYAIVHKDYVLGYASPLKNILMEYEGGNSGLPYRYTYGLEKNNTVIYGIPNGVGELMQGFTYPGGAANVVKLYYHHDRLGSTSYLTDNVSGKVASFVSYDDWGAPTMKPILRLGERELDLVTEYTGHMYDPLLGAYYARARMYDAGDRRFMAEDLLGGSITGLTLNPYVYVICNPLKFVDPFGLYVLENYEYQKNMEKSNFLRKFLDPYQSVYLEEGLRESALGIIYASMYSNGRAGSIDLLALVNENTLEADAIFSAVRKLTTIHTSGGRPPRELDAYLLDRLQNIYTLFNYNTKKIWDQWIIDEEMFGYIEKLSCGIQKEIDKQGWSWKRFQEKYLASAADMANAVTSVAYSMVFYAYSDARKADDAERAARNASKGSGNALPANRQALNQNLTSRGYINKGQTGGGDVEYGHPNGTKVWVRPNGEVITVRREWLPDGSRKIDVRYMWDGTPVPNSGHNTGQFVEPILGGSFVPPLKGE
jgi:RHS repeat-associated protein